jgi:hypothetical protein
MIIEPERSGETISDVCIAFGVRYSKVHEMFKTTAIDTLKQDKKCQPCWYIFLSTMSGSTTVKEQV